MSSKNSSTSNTTNGKRLKFSYFEPVAGIIFAIVASVIFFFFSRIIAVVFVSGPLIPTFDEAVIKTLWLPILLWAILRIAVEIAYLIERRYTVRLAIITVIGNLLAFVCTLIIFIPVRIVNIEYINWIYTYFTGGAAWFGDILANPHIIIIVIMLIGLILDSITVIRKGKLSKAKRDEEDVDDGIYTKEVNADAEESKPETEDVSTETEQ